MKSKTKTMPTSLRGARTSRRSPLKATVAAILSITSAVSLSVTSAAFVSTHFRAGSGTGASCLSSVRRSAGGCAVQSESRFMGRTMTLKTPSSYSSSSSRSGRKGTELGMFLGNDGGILGVGAPEVVS